MKFFITLLLALIFLTVPPANAAYTVTNTFVVSVSNTVSIVISGNISTTINADTGALDSGLSINYRINSNEDLSNIRLRALVLDDTSTKRSAFDATSVSNVSSKSINLVLGSFEHPPTLSSINDCKLASPSSLANPDAIAYPGTVFINNGGRISYNTSDGFFSCNVKKNTTDLHMSLTTTPKSGTYDSATAMDGPDSFQVEIYLDNIP